MPVSLPPDLPLEMHTPEGLPLQFANFTYVQGAGQEVIISFYQAVVAVQGNPERVKEVKSIPAECIARFAMNKGVADWLLHGLADVLGYEVSRGKAKP
jgi:hypothetical protein